MTQLPVQVATIREFCPVCADSEAPGQVMFAVPAGEAWMSVPCPHCTDATQLLTILEGCREKAS